MTKILVVSDTHGNKDGLMEVVKTCKCEHVFFLGDLLKDVEELNIKNLVKVRGNWDYDFKVKLTEFLEIENVKIMLTHGHKYGVKNGLGALINEGKKEHCKLVCYGHTHVQNFLEVDGIYLLNPGALSNFKKGKFTYAVVTIDNGKIYVNMQNNLK